MQPRLWMDRNILGLTLVLLSMIRGDSFFVAGVSFNEPKICPNATWNDNGIIFADSSVIGSNPQTFFMNTNNTAYAVNSQNGKIVIWLEGSTSPTGTVGTNSTSVYTLFVTPEADIYIDNWSHNGVDVWREGTANCVSTLYINGGCYSVFIDTNDALYCSLQNSHRVIKRSLNSSDSQLATVAGTGCPGYQASTLFTPRGIFITTNFNLYVADAGNHRIQRFQQGQVNGTTMAGREAPGTIQLRSPMAVMLDADGYIFILDSENSRIVGSGPYGFRCVIGCTGVQGSASNQLSNPYSMAFDSYGNIFVADTKNDRLQKFVLSFHSCGK